MKLPLIKTSVLKEFYAFLAVGLCNFIQGFTFTFNAFLKVGNDGASSATQASVSGSLNFIATSFGLILFTWIVNHWGRKISIIIVHILYILSGSMFIFMNNETHYLFYLNRILSGVGNGSAAVVMLYLSEVCHKSRRGTFGRSLIFFHMCGFLISYFVQFYFPPYVLGIIELIIGCVGVVAVSIIPETKYWYLLKNQFEEAEKSAKWFNKSITKIELENELKEIQAENQDTESLISYLKQWPNLKNYLIAQALLLSRTLCGRTQIAVYPEYFFTSLQTIYDPRKLTMITVVFDFIVGLMATFIIGKFNRRSSVYFGIGIFVPCLCFIMTIHQFVDQMNEICPWLQVVLVMAYTSTASAFVYPLIDVILVETMSSSKEKRASIMNTCMIFLNMYVAINTFTFPITVENFSIVFPLAYFLCGNIMLFLVILFFIPETHNKALHKCRNLKPTTKNFRRNV